MKLLWGEWDFSVWMWVLWAWECSEKQWWGGSPSFRAALGQCWWHWATLSSTSGDADG